MDGVWYFILWHFCCHKVFGQTKNKTYQRLHENRVHVDLSLKGYLIFNVIYHDLATGFPIWPPILLYIWYKKNSYLLILNREYFDDLLVKRGIYISRYIIKIFVFIYIYIWRYMLKCVYKRRKQSWRKKISIIAKLQTVVWNQVSKKWTYVEVENV